MKNAIFHLTHGKAVTGFEPVMKVLQTSALPLGYTAIIYNVKTGVAGFEPTHEGVKVPCLTAWLYPNGCAKQPDARFSGFAFRLQPGN